RGRGGPARAVGVRPAGACSGFGLVPSTGTRGGGWQGGARRGDARLRNALVTGQVAMATTLLIGAGLLINSFGKLARVDPGWNASGLLTFYLVMPQDYATARKAALIEDLLAELRRMPGVQGAGFTYRGPLF